MPLPNIILVLLDDMGWRDLSCTGSTFYETPHIDRLCAQGMRFTSAYAACPVCSPSRGSILTGRYPARLGLTDWIDMTGAYHPLRGALVDAPYIKHLPKGEVTIAQALKEHGYDTWHVGKWHLGGPEHYPQRCGFELNIAGCALGHPHNGYFSPYGIENLDDGPDGEYLTDRLTDEAIALIRSSTGRPFFLNLWHYAVHNPIQAKAGDIRRFRAKAEALGLDRVQALEPGEAFPIQRKQHERVTRRTVQSSPDYAAMIWNLDENIGRLAGALEQCGKLDSTVIIFTSDNGGLSTSEGSPTCNAPASQGKGWTYDGGTRVPLFIRYPALIAPGGVCDTPVISTDLYPTLLELAGAPLRPMQHCDGTSLAPLLGGGAIPERPLFWHYPHYGNQGGTPSAAVLLGRYKLIEFFEDNRAELYDIDADIGEKHDLADARPDIAAHLRQQLHAWQEDVKARFPARA